MPESQELQVQQKREVEKKTEGTTPGRAFVPVTDIFETPEALTVVLEMPGVDRNSIEASEVGLISRSMRGCSRSTPNTWATTRAAFRFPTRSTKARLALK
jgi:hypothetical protein